MVITSRTRNAVAGFRHVGSNPTVSVNPSRSKSRSDASIYKIIQCLIQQLWFDGLCQMCIHARHFGFLHILIKSIGRHCNNGNCPCCFFRQMTNGIGRLQPIHLRHANIHQYGIIIPYRCCRIHLQCPQAIVRMFNNKSSGL